MRGPTPLPLSNAHECGHSINQRIRRTNIIYYTDTTQHGEGRVIVAHFLTRPLINRCAVEVGCLGKEISNVWGLAQLGWRVLLVEPNPDMAPIINRDYARTDFKLEVCGAAPTEGSADCYLHTIPAHNSFKRDWYPQTLNGKTYEMALYRLEDILRRNAVPLDLDFLSIDTEGMDYEIMQQFLGSDYRPGLIITEAKSYGTEAVADSLYGQYGYTRLVSTGPVDYGNLCYARR